MQKSKAIFVIFAIIIVVAGVVLSIIFKSEHTNVKNQLNDKIIYVVAKGQLQEARNLINRGADVNYAYDPGWVEEPLYPEGWAPLHIAAFMGMWRW